MTKAKNRIVKVFSQNRQCQKDVFKSNSTWQFVICEDWIFSHITIFIVQIVVFDSSWQQTTNIRRFWRQQEVRIKCYNLSCEVIRKLKRHRLFVSKIDRIYIISQSFIHFDRNSLLINRIRVRWHCLNVEENKTFNRFVRVVNHYLYEL